MLANTRHVGTRLLLISRVWRRAAPRVNKSRCDLPGVEMLPGPKRPSWSLVRKGSLFCTKQQPKKRSGLRSAGAEQRKGIVNKVILRFTLMTFYPDTASRT